MTDLLPPGFVFHQSNLQAYENCRYSFLLRYVRKLPWPAPLAERTITFEKDIAAGSMLHSLLHQYFLGFDPELLSSCAREYPDDRVLLWLENFLASTYAKIAPNQFPEHSLQILLDDSPLLAKFDLLTIEGDTIQIYDWKTSRVLPKRQSLERRIQTSVYPLVAAQTQPKTPRLVTMHYWGASFPDQPIIFEFDSAKLEHHRETLAKLINSIRSLPEEQFERTNNLKTCSYCEYQSYCLRGGSPTDEDSFDNWFDIGMTELQE